MNVLLIAPDFGLTHVQNEVRAVSAALRPAVLTGVVNRQDLIEALRDRSWDVIWFATHGDEKGLRLSDGPISIADLTAVVRTSGASLVVLNSCSSRLIGLELHYELHTAVICTVTEVDDASAYQTGALLAQHLAAGKSIAEAFAASRPGQAKNYYLFDTPQNDETTEVRTILMLNEWGSRLSAKIDRIEERLDQEIGVLRQDLNTLSDNVQAAVRLSPWHRVTFVVAFGLLCLPIPLFYQEIRDWLDISWYSALVLTISSYALSMMLWSYMWWGHD